MKRLFTLFLFVFLQLYLVKGQDTLTYYLNNRLKITKNKESAKYIRKAFQVLDYWCVRDYYSDGTLMMTGNYIDKEFTRKYSIFRNYYPSGKIKSIEQFNDNKKDGKWTQYYENGQIDYQVEYSNNTKTGEWLWYFENGQLSAKEKYENDVRVKAKFWNEEGKKVEPAEAEYEPSFEGEGIEKFSRLIIDNAKYPVEMAKSDIKGIVKIGFTISEKGEITNIIIKESVYSRIDNVVYKLVEYAPKWKPGKLHGRLFPYDYEIAVNMEYIPE